MFKIKKLCIISLLLAILFMACNDNKEQSLSKKFDRSAMLTQYANNIIVPAYVQALNAALELETAVSEFTNSRTTSDLINARNKWQQAALVWQHSNAFNFGPAGEVNTQKSLNEEIATFPVSKSAIEGFISANDTLFNNFSRDTRGYFAVEYLLFDEKVADIDVINKFTQNPWRTYYLKACVTQLKIRLQKVVTEWSVYKSSFIQNNGTDIGSSTSYLYNEFLKSFESLKNYKLGIPLGRRPGQTAPIPENVEAYYSGYSTILAKEHWKSIQNIWEGRALNGTDGIGFKAYLESAEGGKDLIILTQQQVLNTQTTFMALPEGKLTDAIKAQYPKVDAVHTELQKLTRFYKSDLSSLIGIAVTYSSGDGD
jgi:uncharacterized protein